mgnify:CR=1 FL=1
MMRMFATLLITCTCVGACGGTQTTTVDVPTRTGVNTTPPDTVARVNAPALPPPGRVTVPLRVDTFARPDTTDTHRVRSVTVTGGTQDDAGTWTPGTLTLDTGTSRLTYPLPAPAETTTVRADSAGLRADVRGTPEPRRVTVETPEPRASFWGRIQTMAYVAVAVLLIALLLRLLPRS